MKKLVITKENPNGSLIDMTEEEITSIEQGRADGQAIQEAYETAKAEQDTLKTSAKAKLIAGEALTEDEANTIVL